MISEKYSLGLLPVVSLFLSDLHKREPVLVNQQLPDDGDNTMFTTFAGENDWMEVNSMGSMVPDDIVNDASTALLDY